VATPLTMPPIVPSTRGALYLSRDGGCTRSLLWRLESSAPLSVGRLGAALERAGYRESSAPPGLHIYDGRGEDRVVFVPRTGRIQLRLSYLRLGERRAEDARELGAAIASALSFGFSSERAGDGDIDRADRDRGERT